MRSGSHDAQDIAGPSVLSDVGSSQSKNKRTVWQGVRWNILWEIFLALLAFSVGHQAARLSTVILPLPDKPWLLISSAFFNWSNFADAKLMCGMIFLAYYAAEWKIYRRMPKSMRATEIFFGLLWRKTRPAVLIASLLFVAIQYNERNVFSVSFLIIIISLIVLPFLINRPRSYFWLPLSMLFLGLTTMPFFTPQNVINFECHADHELVLEDGRRLMCETVNNLPDAGILIINTVNQRFVVATNNIAPDALERVIDGRGYLIK